MPDRVGQQLGNYQLTRLLGEGGFAEVYLGEHIHLGSQAAIKVLHSQLTSEDVDKFRTEARNLVRLVHPHIVRILDFGLEGKTPFLVMDYAANGTLRQLHPKGTILPLTTIISYVKQIADALQFAHDEKLIHRDIKPENMLLGRRNEILLSDFGIAIVAQSSRYQNAQDMAGTIAYMAPEQIQAHPRPASDQYSLGIVVYEWLTGDRPFHGSFTEIAIKHSVVPPPPLHEKVPTILPDVEEVVMMALAKDPKQRFGSVQAFANALEQASQEGMPTFVKPSALMPTQTVQPSPPPMTQPPRVVIPSQPSVTPPFAPTWPVTSNRSAGTVLYIYRGHADKVKAVAWSPDGMQIASGGDDRAMHIWNATSGDNVFIYRSHADILTALAWAPDRKLIASGSQDQTVQVWDTLKRNYIFILTGHSKAVRAVAWSPDGKYIASGSEDRTVQIWHSSTGGKNFAYRNHSGSVNALAWSSDSNYIVSASDDFTVHQWNATTGHRTATYRGHSGWVGAVAWSHDGKYIASGGYDTTVQVWNASTGKNIYTYRDHVTPVYTLAWSRDGKYIASGDANGRVRIWNATNGNKIFTYRGHSGIVRSVAWSPDGKYIASGGDDKTVQVWVAP